MRFDLDRYNRVVWGLLGTLALVGLALLLVTGAISLWPGRRLAGTLPTQGAADQPEPATPAPALRLGLPEAIPGTEFVLIPVEALLEGRRGGGGGFSGYSKGEPGAPLFNMVFLNTRTRATHALLARKALITRYEVLEDGRGDAAKAAALVLRMVESDTNRNGRLDDEDAEKVYLCDPSGRDLREILPAGATCERWQYEPGRRTLYLLTRPQGEGLAGGPRDVLAVALDSRQPAEPLLPKEQSDSLRALLHR